MKIHRIIARLNIGGPAIQALQLLEYFPSTLITGHVPDNEKEIDKKAFTQAIDRIIYEKNLVREIRPISDLKALIHLYRLLKKEKPDIVHTHTAKAGMIGRLAAWLAGVPVIIHTFHGHVFHSYFGRLKTQFFILIEKVLLRISSKIICISELQKEEIQRVLNAPDHKITCIPLGFDLKRFRVPPQNKFYLHQKLGLAPDQKIIANIGRLTGVKNQSLFVNIADVVKTKKDFHFVLIGEGEEQAALLQQIKALTLENISIIPFEDDVVPIYQSIYGLILTSKNEGTPVVILESLASYKPVIASRVGGVPNLVTESVNGFLISEPDPRKYAAALNQLPALTTAPGFRPSCDKIIEQYDIKNLQENMEKLYTTLHSCSVNR